MQASIYPFIVHNLRGEEVSLSEYKGKVLLIVNTASLCGFTPQLKGLELLYQKFKSQGFEVLAFPCNDFGAQQPEKGEAIQQFCERHYQTTFPIFNTVLIKNNPHPLFHFLSNKQLNGKVNVAPKWNFHKYLINRNGEVVDFFFPFMPPNSWYVRWKIKRLLRNH